LNTYEAKIMVVRESDKTYKVRQASDMAAFWESEVKKSAAWQEEKEMFVVVCMDNKINVKSWHIVSMGLLNQSLVHPRETFRPAIMDSAASVIVMHNHPTGDPTPSAEDISTTRQLIDAGKLLGITLLDHIIIGAGDTPYHSMQASGILAFDKQHGQQ